MPLRRRERFWSGFSFDLKLIDNLCLPFSCCFWVFSTPSLLLPKQFPQFLFVFFVQLIQSFTHFSLKWKIKSSFLLKILFQSMFLYFFNFSTKASLYVAEQKLMFSMILPFFHSKLQGKSIHAGLLLAGIRMAMICVIRGWKQTWRSASSSEVLCGNREKSLQVEVSLHSVSCFILVSWVRGEVSKVQEIFWVSIA